MNTTYKEIFGYFKDNITDPDLLLFAKDIQNEILISIMDKAIMKCSRVVKATVDLSLRSDDEMTFNVEIPIEIIDIITEWMTVVWLKPFVNNIENLRNSISTKEFKVFSPGDLLGKIGTRYDKSIKDSRSLMNEYSFITADMTRLK